VGVGPAGAVRIEVLSGRGDLITGGDAYLRVVLPRGASARDLRVDDDGRDRRASSPPVRPGWTAWYTGSQPAQLRAGGPARRPRGPDHPHRRSAWRPGVQRPAIQPWTCSAGARDAKCNRPPTYAYVYKSTAGGSLRSYDPKNPPSDVATTTTDQGRTVPFIVRQETGVRVRDEYRIAVLYDPAEPWDPTAAQPGYNHKLVLTHGASCDTAYQMGAAPDVLGDALGRGFAVASHALDNAGHNCNRVG